MPHLRLLNLHVRRERERRNLGGISLCYLGHRRLFLQDLREVGIPHGLALPLRLSQTQRALLLPHNHERLPVHLLRTEPRQRGGGRAARRQPASERLRRHYLKGPRGQGGARVEHRPTLRRKVSEEQHYFSNYPDTKESGFFTLEMLLQSMSTP